METIAPALNELLGKNHWKVDLQNPGKTLTVTGENMEIKDVQSVVKRAGFKVERALTDSVYGTKYIRLYHIPITLVLRQIVPLCYICLKPDISGINNA